MRLSFLAALLSVTILAGCTSNTSRFDCTSLVDTRIGTESSFVLSYGNTYPATGRPFGMNLWSPQTGEHGDGWKYTWQSDEIRAFSQAHQCSPWTRDYAAFALFPETGELEVRQALRGAKFSHDDETARPQYYSVTFRNGIRSEMAPTERGNHLRFTYPADAPAYLLIDGGINFADLSVDEQSRTVKGLLKFPCCWIFLTFDTPVKSFGAWHDVNKPEYVSYRTPEMLAAALKPKPEMEQPEIFPGTDTVKGENAGFYLEFEPGRTVQVKVATSFISAEQAELNYKQELASHDTFERTLEEGTGIWNDLLGRIAVEGGTPDQRRTFYACLYHASLFPRMFHEYDAEGNPHHYDANTRTVYPGYGFNDIGYWDAFRSQFPLFNILFPRMQERYMQSIIESYEHDGFMPSWPFFGETFGMIGNHAVSLLADAWAKGIRSFNPKDALKAYNEQISGDDAVSLEKIQKLGFRTSFGRYGAVPYEEKGYVPYPDYNYGTAVTLEYAYDDFCAWTLAKAAGDRESEDRYGRTMFNYRNVFDSESGFMRGRGADGRWTPDFNPVAWGGPFIEGNAMHYTWSVFQDVNGLINLYGGEAEFCRHLDAVFDVPGIIDLGFYEDVYNEMVEMVVAGLGQYEHGNQPIHHMPYLYDYAGQPWKTQFRVRQIMDKVYNPGPKGYPGDEDQGSMSAWYVFSALGFYPITPGSTQYAIGSPLFSRASISLENGRTFTVTAENNSRENVYIQSATLNGRPIERNWIDHSEIMAGGELHFVMGPEPDKDRCTSKEASPFSLSLHD